MKRATGKEVHSRIRRGLMYPLTARSTIERRQWDLFYEWRVAKRLFYVVVCPVAIAAFILLGPFTG